jgi:hypothetical protein
MGSGSLKILSEGIFVWLRIEQGSRNNTPKHINVNNLNTDLMAAVYHILIFMHRRNQKTTQKSMTRLISEVGNRHKPKKSI